MNVFNVYQEPMIKKLDITDFEYMDDKKRNKLYNLYNHCCKRCATEEKTKREIFEEDVEELEKNIYKSLIKQFVSLTFYRHSGYNNEASDIRWLKDRNPNAKVVGIMYSGGLDSTTLILRELDKGNIVIPIMNKFNSSDDESAMFKYMMAEITIHKINERIHDLNHEKRNVERNKRYLLVNPIICNFVEFGCLQPDDFVYTQQLFTSVAPACIGYERIHLIDKIMIGTVLGDQGVSYINDMKRLYSCALKFQREPEKGKTSNISEKDTSATLEFPLMKTAKFEVASEFDYLCYIFGFSVNNVLPTFSCENLQIRYKIVFKGNSIYLRINTLPCKVLYNKRTICGSCNFDYERNIDAYRIYFKLDEQDIKEGMKSENEILQKYLKLLVYNFDKYKNERKINKLPNKKPGVYLDGYFYDEDENKLKEVKSIKDKKTLDKLKTTRAEKCGNQIPYNKIKRKETLLGDIIEDIPRREKRFRDIDKQHFDAINNKDRDKFMFPAKK